MKHGYPVLIETIAASDTVTYSKKVIYPGQTIRLVLSGGKGDVAFCREFLGMPELGRNTKLTVGPQTYHVATGPEVLAEVWASDVEDAELANKIWRTAEMTTASQVILDKTAGGLAYSHVMEFLLDDQDDVIRTRLGMNRRYGDFMAPALPLEALMFSINHKESDDTKLLQVQIRKGPAVDDKYCTIGGGWGAGPVWNDITGAAAEAWLHLGTCTPDDATKPYTLALRPKADAAAETSHISHIGLHQQVSYGTGTLLTDGEEYTFTAPYRCRIGIDMVAAGSGVLSISEITELRGQ